MPIRSSTLTPVQVSQARETAAPYTAGRELTDALARVVGAVDQLVAVDVESSEEDAIRDTLGGVQRQIRRLEAHRTTLTSQLTKRQAARINPSDPSDLRAKQQAEQDTQKELASELNLTPSEAKTAVVAGKGLEDLSPDTNRAFRDGQLTPTHARKLAETMRRLSPVLEPDICARLESELLDAAKSQDVVAFGRTCRAAEARHDTARAQKRLDAQRQDRYGKTWWDEAGMFHIRAGFVGIEAEIVATAFEVFRSKDADGEFRTTDQRTADAIFETCKKGLRHADKLSHGNRP